jgi:hypothetical protein
MIRQHQVTFSDGTMQGNVSSVSDHPIDFMMTAHDVSLGRHWFIYSKNEIYEIGVWQTPDGYIYGRYENSSYLSIFYIAGHIYETKDDCMKDYDRKYPNIKPRHVITDLRDWNKTVTKVESR